MKLPKKFSQYFWEHDFSKLNWEKHRFLIVSRLLSEGDWTAIVWLRQKIGDVQLKKWIMENSGKSLSPKQLRFWEVILDLPRSRVSVWVKKAKSSQWNLRTRKQ